MGSKVFGKGLLNIPAAGIVAVEKLLRPATKPRPDAVKCILVLQYKLALGYCVHLTPLFEAIKRQRPEITVIVATWGMGVSVLRHSPYVDHLIETPNVLDDFSGAVASLRRQLKMRGLRPDCCLTGVADQRTKIGLLAAAVCTGWQGGFAILPSLYQRPLSYNRGISLLDNNLRLADLLGLSQESLEPKVFYSPQDAAVARVLVEAARVDGHPVLAVIARGSGALPTEWHDERWVETVRYAHQALGYSVVYVGTGADVAALENLKALAGNIGTSLAGATTINQLAAVIALSDMVVSIDTGGMHVTRAVGTPMVILGLAWEKPVIWLATGRDNIRILRGPDVEKAPPGYRLDDISIEWATRELADMTKLFPPDDAARDSRLKVGLSNFDLMGGILRPTDAGSRLHLPALDGVRGLAILLVLVHHLLASNLATGNRFIDAVNAIREASWVGVDLFFVLSGFLITGILFDSLSSQGYFKNFYVRRVLRIFPLYYGFLLVLICLTYPLHLHWNGMQYTLLTYTQNLGMFTGNYTVRFSPAPFINLDQFWSLAVEEQFYLIWPLILFMVRDLRKLILTASALSVCALVLRVVLVAHGAPKNEIYMMIGCRADSLMIGGILALLLRTSARAALLRYSGFAFLAGCLILFSIGVYCRGFPSDNHFVDTFGYSMIAITFAGLVGATLARPSWTRMAFENGFMRFFGKYSYGIYVFHFSLDAAFTGMLRRWLDATFHSKAIGVGLGGLVVTLLTVFVAVLSYQLYEKRFLELKKYFEPRGAWAR